MSSGLCIVHFHTCTSQTGILWETREVDTIKLSHQIESSVFFYQISVLDLKRHLQAAGSMLSSMVSSFFPSMLTIAWTTACTVELMIIFSSIPEQKRDKGPEQGQLFFVGQSFVFFSA